MRNQNNKSKVTDTVDTSSLEQLIKKTNEEYSEDTFTNGLVKNMDLYDDIQVNVPRSMAKEPNKESIDQRRVLSKQKPKGKAPPKFAKSKEDLKEEFDVIEIPIIMKEYEEWIKKNPSKDFQDFLKEYRSEVEEEKRRFNDIILAGALGKIDNAMSGIMTTLARGGVVKDPTYTYYSDGGASKNKPREPKVKKLNLSDYFRYGMTIAELNETERELVNELLKKTLSKSSTDN